MGANIEFKNHWLTRIKMVKIIVEKWSDSGIPTKNTKNLIKAWKGVNGMLGVNKIAKNMLFIW